jgi:hypothetical protein
MAELTEEQKKQVEETLRQVSSGLSAQNAIKITITGGGNGTFKTDNPRFVIERRRD